MKIFTVKDSSGLLTDVFSYTYSGAKKKFISSFWIGDIGLPLDAISAIWNRYYKQGFRIHEFEIFDASDEAADVEYEEPIPDSAFDVLSKASTILDKSRDMTPDPDSI